MSVSFTTYLFPRPAIPFLSSTNSRNSGLNTFFFIPIFNLSSLTKETKRLCGHSIPFRKVRNEGKAGITHVVKTRMTGKHFNSSTEALHTHVGETRMRKVNEEEKTVSNRVDSRSLSREAKEAMNEHFPKQ